MSMAMKYAMKKRMAKGGCPGESCPGCAMCKGGMMAEGGVVDADADEEMESGYEKMPMAEGKDNEAADMEDSDMIMRIMKARKMSKGGMVANDTPPVADFDDNDFDDLAMRDDLEGHYSGSEEIGDKQLDEDDRDIVARVMRSRSKKDRMPRPA